MLGLYLFDHPLKKYAYEIQNLSNFDFSKPLAQFDEKKISLGGMITSTNIRLDRRNRKYAFFTLESLKGIVECMVFSKKFKALEEFLVEDINV